MLLLIVDWHGGLIFFSRSAHLCHSSRYLHTGCILHHSSSIHLRPRINRRHISWLLDCTLSQVRKKCLIQVFEREVTFSSDFFFSLLLPPIVFSVGYSIKKPQFFQHFLTIIFFGTISTILAILMQTTLLSLLNEAIFIDLSPKDILLVTIITSSSDPITGLSLLKVIFW